MKMKEWLMYEYSTMTIRQMPQNYMIAHKKNGEWICNSDPACNEEFALLVFLLTLRHHHLRWGSGETLLEALTNEMEQG
jgi:hypothetical protein